jgi:hypothetical protein
MWFWLSYLSFTSFFVRISILILIGLILILFIYFFNLACSDFILLSANKLGLITEFHSTSDQVVVAGL